jgi:hypothetical protein
MAALELSRGENYDSYTVRTSSWQQELCDDYHFVGENYVRVLIKHDHLLNY